MVFRTDFQMFLFVFESLNGPVPSYLSELLTLSLFSQILKATFPFPSQSWTGDRRRGLYGRDSVCPTLQIKQSASLSSFKPLVKIYFQNKAFNIKNCVSQINYYSSVLVKYRPTVIKTFNLRQACLSSTYT